MITSTITKASALNTLLLINIFLLMLALNGIPWIKWLAILPWLITTLSKGGMRQIISTINDHRIAFLLSLLISIFIYTGCWQYHCDRQERMSYLIPLLWVPIASAVKSNLRLSEPKGFGLHLFFVIFLAISIVSCALFWQHFIENHPRPPAFSSNVLIAPMLMGMTCVLFMLKSTWPSNGQHSRTLRNFSVAALLFATAGSMMTFSKTGLLVFAVAVAIRMVTVPSTRKVLFWASLPLIMLWTIFISDTLNVVRTDIAKYEEGSRRTSLGERLDAITWGTENVRSVPLQGIGREELRFKFNERWRDWGLKESDVTPMPHLHNDYLQIAIAYGIISSASFALFWIILAAKATKTLRRAMNHEASFHTNSWFLTFTGIFITAFMLDSFTHWPSAWLMINASLGIGLGLLSSNSLTVSSEPR